MQKDRQPTWTSLKMLIKYIYITLYMMRITSQFAQRYNSIVLIKSSIESIPFKVL